MINFFILILAIVYIIILLVNRKAIYALPYLLITIITPIYNFLDSKIFVEIFGCGCVPSVQTNMFNIAFNANDLRRSIYLAISIIMSVIAFIISRKFKNTISKVIYIVTVLLVNLILTYIVCRLYMWA